MQLSHEYINHWVQQNHWVQVIVMPDDDLASEVSLSSDAEIMLIRRDAQAARVTLRVIMEQGVTHLWLNMPSELQPALMEFVRIFARVHELQSVESARMLAKQIRTYLQFPSPLRETRARTQIPGTQWSVENRDGRVVLDVENTVFQLFVIIGQDFERIWSFATDKHGPVVLES
jgi:hypothetical protein